ncbi:hypothetical protein K435DRAFT_787700 [Dendrothele bispora CBS 962.96]|uniref:Uncharacterized protein n=1 Tax=Dendrothele bispora (strain CBS 962.96) TaxID=1314807 RepID=A0A4S8MXM3_DENBC|nr:hypothetical protein K435DRAFT_787700 [Dendrothele bispora CBS 962.96]
MPRYPTRTASFIITLLGAISNCLITFKVLATWRSIRWEPESEWEASSDKWTLNGIKIAWGLLLIYFSSATAVCAIGFAGVIRSKPALVKFYRDYSIADFTFCALFTLLTAYGATLPTTSVGVCDSLSRQPELMRDLADMGLSSENCEKWFKRAAVAFIGFMFLTLLARLHFILAISIYYSHLFRHYPGRIPMPLSPTHSHSHSRSSFRRRSMDNLQRVYLLPRSITELQQCSSPVSPTSPAYSESGMTTTNEPAEEIIMYAPVPLSKLPREVAQNLKRAATEGWVKTATTSPLSPTSSSSSSSSSSSTSASHRHSHRHHHSSSSSHHHHHHSNGSMDVMTGSGHISLPISPDEGLFSGRVLRSSDIERGNDEKA